MRLRMRLFLLSALFFLYASSHAWAGTQNSHSAEIEKIFSEITGKLEKSPQRRPFRFKGMNDSLALTRQALLSAKQIRGEANPAMPAWPAAGPLTPAVPAVNSKTMSQNDWAVLEQAQAAYGSNTLILALKGYWLQSSGHSAEANAVWQEYLYQARSYSDFDRELLSRGQFDALHRAVEKQLRSQGVDPSALAEERLINSPWKRIWQQMHRPGPDEKTLNRIFWIVLALGTLFLFAAFVSGVELYRSFGFSLIIFYVSSWAMYGSWIYGLVFGWPASLQTQQVFMGIVTIALGVIGYEVFSAWRDAHPQLDEGFRRCPQCKEVIVKLSVECAHCKKKLRPQR